MKILNTFGRKDIAFVHIAENEKGQRVEFVESVEPPIPLKKKWVNIVSTLFGCPVKCPICDAGDSYTGKLSSEEILFQIDYLLRKHFPDATIPVEKWKIQFARMGEPAFNHHVIDVLEMLPELYDAPGLLPSISTIAPASADRFFGRLLEVKKRLYPRRFQFQYSVHSTDVAVRNRLIPLKTWSFGRMAEFGSSMYEPGGRKVTLNFALIQDVPIDPAVLLEYFSPEVFLIKVTPLNPTFRVKQNGFQPLPFEGEEFKTIVSKFQDAGYQVIVSIGELEENAIGSNCGQYVSAMKEGVKIDGDAYAYALK